MVEKIPASAPNPTKQFLTSFLKAYTSKINKVIMPTEKPTEANA